MKKGEDAMITSRAMRKSKRVALTATERHAMKSKATGKTYEISIALPYAYAQGDMGAGPFYKSLAAWHVVYLTDANWHMGMVTEFVREMAWCGRTWDAIVVGIGYPQAESAREDWRKISQLRSHDLTPVAIQEEDESMTEWLKRPVKTGGGGKFLSFLKQELIPWIEKDYRADPAKRILVGHSYGGLFALYAMLREPGLFRSYIAASPYLKDPQRTILTMESEFAKSHKDLEGQLYLAAGELETSAEDTTLTDMYRIAGLLESRNYKGLSLTKQVFADNNHCEVAAPALHAGLKLALKK